MPYGHDSQNNLFPRAALRNSGTKMPAHTQRLNLIMISNQVPFSSHLSCQLYCHLNLADTLCEPAGLGRVMASGAVLKIKLMFAMQVPIQFTSDNVNSEAVSNLTTCERLE